MNELWFIVANVMFLILAVPVRMQCSFNALDIAEYEGCWFDDKSRKYPYSYGNTYFGNMTLDWCIFLCADEGYAFAGLQHHQWCHCGVDPYLTSTTHPKVADSECNTPCHGNTEQICGGSYRMSVFKTHFKSHNAKREYTTAFFGQSITNYPLNTEKVTGTGLRAIVNCAHFCNKTPQCKVFSHSATTNMCHMFRYNKLCDPLKYDAPSMTFYLL